jgi:hypothetical protein
MKASYRTFRQNLRDEVTLSSIPDVRHYINELAIQKMRMLRSSKRYDR